MYKDKKFKHLIMRSARFVAPRLFEKLRYLIFLGYWPDFDYPTTISEYLVNKKLKGGIICPELCGKLEGYKYVSEKFPFVSMPRFICLVDSEHSFLGLREGEYILKASNASGCFVTFSVRESEIGLKSRELFAMSLKWLKSNYASISGENVYSSAKNAVFVEENVLGTATLAVDLKIHCNNGDAVIVQQIDRSSGKLRRKTWLNSSGELVDIDLYRDESIHDVSIIPEYVIREGCRLAGEMSCGLGYVRVDFILNERFELFFVEFTYFPAGGTMPLLSKTKDQLFYTLLSRSKPLN